MYIQNNYGKTYVTSWGYNCESHVLIAGIKMNILAITTSSTLIGFTLSSKACMRYFFELIYVSRFVQPFIALRYLNLKTETI